jgi:ubiquinol-cytochrome c reductase cytochrome c subunit
VPGQGPSLVGVGALAADFYLRTGYMPLEDPHQQPTRSRVLFSEQEIRAMVAYVASLGNGPPIPSPSPQHGSVSSGQKLFVDHCAGCHQIAAQGGYVTGARVPPLDHATDRQIAEAVRIGPYLMPHFSKTEITDRQLDSLIAYVDYMKHPVDAGGWSLGHLGPWPEGMVTWLLAAVSLVVLCVIIGRRLPS